MTAQAEVVICGAGIGGIATTYFLSVVEGVKDVTLVDPRPPLSLTSDKSTEAYRNWWPGPGDEMVALMNRSIDLLEQFAIECGNRFHLNRRGYLYISAKEGGLRRLEGFAQEASSRGAGEIRRHRSGASEYVPVQAEGFQGGMAGADLFEGSEIIQQHFPYLSKAVTAALHVRRAGWLSAQQYGNWMLEQARAAGAKLLQDEVVGVIVTGGAVAGVELASGDKIATSHFVNAAGPFLREVGALVGVDIPVYNELHLKASIDDVAGAVDRDGPMVIVADPQTLAWSEAEADDLASDPELAWLVGELPLGAHTRPEGGQNAQTVLMLWDTHNEPVDVVVPPEIDPMYAEVAIRGLTAYMPRFETYLERMPKPYLDGGYYTKTQENRPLASPLPVEGAYVIGAMSGYGIMASAGLGELTAKHVVGGALPHYAPAFQLDRYQDPNYQAQLDNWGDSWQL